MVTERHLWTGDLFADAEYLEGCASSQMVVTGPAGLPAFTLVLQTYVLAEKRRTKRIVLYEVRDGARLVASIERAVAAGGHGAAYTSELDQARADLAEFYTTHTDPDFTVKIEREES